MGSSTLHFSIDLDAEIQKITQRQHLNQVNYIVQLVRHALDHNPERIHIQASSTFLEIDQNGDAFDPGEWSRLLRIVNEQDAPEHRQEALSQLESTYGITLLSLILNFPRVEIESDGLRLVAISGQLSEQPGENDASGYRIRLYRPKSLVKDEKSELEFYCAGSDIPISYNGRSINEAIRFAGQILTARFKTADGSGAIGIPLNGDTNVITLYKHGVRLGVKQTIPRDGALFHGYWSSHLTGYESNFSKSILVGERHLLSHLDLLYDAINDHFSDMNDRQRIRIKRVLFGRPGRQWLLRFGSLPLFHGCRRNFALSLRDLLALHKQFHDIPYSPVRSSGLPAFIPHLQPEDISFLRKRLKLGIKLTKVKKRACRLPLRHYLKREEPYVDEDVGELSAEQAAFLTGLNKGDFGVRFCFTNRESYSIPLENGSKLICLHFTDKNVVTALTQYRDKPDALSIIKYSLLKKLQL